MPIYDYVCSRCHRLTEVVHGIEAEGPRFCPECGAEATMTKVFSAPSVHFKGTGWAKKDRGSSARAARAKDETGAASGDGAKGDGAKADSTKSEAGSPGGSSSSSESSSRGESSSSSGGKSSSDSGPTSSGAESKPASGASD